MKPSEIYYLINDEYSAKIKYFVEPINKLLVIIDEMAEDIKQLKQVTTNLNLQKTIMAEIIKNKRHDFSKEEPKLFEEREWEK